jgi:hypothetical protein
MAIQQEIQGRKLRVFVLEGLPASGKTRALNSLASNHWKAANLVNDLFLPEDLMLENMLVITEPKTGEFKSDVFQHLSECKWCPSERHAPKNNKLYEKWHMSEHFAYWDKIMIDHDLTVADFLNQHKWDKDEKFQNWTRLFRLFTTLLKCSKMLKYTRQDKKIKYVLIERFIYTDVLMQPTVQGSEELKKHLLAIKIERFYFVGLDAAKIVLKRMGEAANEKQINATASKLKNLAEELAKVFPNLPIFHVGVYDNAGYFLNV